MVRPPRAALWVASVTSEAGEGVASSDPVDHRPCASIVVPFFNPGSRLRPTLERLVAAMTRAEVTCEIVAVSDGSTDGSDRDLRDCPVQGVQLVELDRNYGKGEALRTGMRLCSGHFVGFVDADGDIPPELVPIFVRLAQESGADAVLGSKVHAGSLMHISRHRRVFSAIWRILVRLFFQLPVSDSQTGIKVFREDVLAAVLPRTSLRGFAFDLEVLIVARDLGYASMVEAPVRVTGGSGSSVSVRHALCMGWDLMSLVWRFRAWGGRRPPRSPA